MNLTKLQGKVPQIVIDEIPEVIRLFNANTPLRMAHFLSQCAHESGNFKAVNENLNYSAQGLLTTFKKYFPTEELAKQYERQPIKIGSRVYANRMGNGDEGSTEGFKFRGRGYIQLTGKDNYKAFGTFLGIDLTMNPDLVATKYPLVSAGYFFNKNNLWAICDKGEGVDTITALSKRINGGTIGLDDRIAKFKVYKDLLS